MAPTYWVFTAGVLLVNLLDLSEGRRCYNSRRSYYYYCSSTEECCNDGSCCYEWSTGAIIGLVIGVIVVITIIALVVYLVYRASKRKRSVETTTTVIGQPTIRTYQTTTYTQGSYGMATYPQGQVYPQNIPQGDPAYPPPPPTYTA